MGISVDSVYCHGAFAEQLGGLDYPLLADFHPKGELVRRFGLWREDKGYSRRAIVILDPNGVVCSVDVIERGAPDVEAILAAVRAIANP